MGEGGGGARGHDVVTMSFRRHFDICDFFLFHIEIEGKCGWIIGGGGGGRGGGVGQKSIPPRPPSSYAYAVISLTAPGQPFPCLD